jgi:hypothetical protein
MTDPTTLGTDTTATLRQRREARVDHDHDIPFGERVTVECPDCDETTEIGIYGCESPSYGPCWSWDCEAYHKFRRDRPAERDDLEDASSALIQTTLEAH